MFELCTASARRPHYEERWIVGRIRGWFRQPAVSADVSEGRKQEERDEREDKRDASGGKRDWEREKEPVREGREKRRRREKRGNGDGEGVGGHLRKQRRRKTKIDRNGGGGRWGRNFRGERVTQKGRENEKIEKANGRESGVVEGTESRWLMGDWQRRKGKVESEGTRNSHQEKRQTREAILSSRPSAFSRRRQLKGPKSRWHFFCFPCLTRSSKWQKVDHGGLLWSERLLVEKLSWTPISGQRAYSVRSVRVIHF